tara:strand:+ start:7698 stop:8720 length:1023 start_codon:yes stop_codon:yes gene_type:complete
MPCTKCKDGKYKWGSTGSCKYNTKEECENANSKYNKEMDKPTTKITELVISPDNEELAIDCISLVSEPAIMVDFVYMNKHKKNNLNLTKIDEHKRQIISPALIPDKSIFRFDAATNSEYYVYFSKETVRQASILYLKNNNHHKATTQHEERVAGVMTVESWIVEDTKKDKSALYNYSLPVGTWCVKLQINNDQIWQRVLDGELRGLSIEGFFVESMEALSKNKYSDKEVLTALADILSPKDKLTKLAGSGITQMLGATKGVNNFSNNLEIGIKELDKVRTSLEVDRSDLKGEMKILVQIVDKLEFQAKDLGISPGDVGGYKEARAAITRGTEISIKTQKL